MTFPILDPQLHDLTPLMTLNNMNEAQFTDSMLSRSIMSIGNPNFINPLYLMDGNSLLTYPYFLNFAPSISVSPQSYLSSPNPAVKRTLHDYAINPLIGSTYSIDSEVNESKKTRLEINTNTEPSRVLHIRNIAPRAQEHDLTLLAVPFGKIKSMVYAKKTNQALIEMCLAVEATRLFDYYTTYPPFFNGKEMIIQYSKHHGLELKLQNNNIDVSVEAANKMVDDHRQRLKELQGERRILRVVIENFKNYNINHLIILKIFQRFGKVMRLIIFTKNMQCQCLIEMDNAISAHVALLHLNGQDMFTDSCRLRVEFSKNCDSLQIQRQNEKCRDYIISPLLEEEKLLLDGLDTQTKNFSNYLSPQVPFSQNMTIVPQQQSNDMLAYQNLSPLDYPFMSGSYPVGMQPPQMVIPDNGVLIQDSAISALNNESLLKSSLSATVDEYPIIMVTNINSKVGVESLFTLFGVYGDVVRIALSSYGCGSALIQMMNQQQAETASRMLNGVPLHNMNLLTTVITKDLIPYTVFNGDLNATHDIKDFSGTPLHRFKKPNSKNHFNIYPPSPILHLSNIPLAMSEEDLIGLFRKYGYECISLKIFQKEKKMALAKMSSLEEAVAALVTLHNCKLNDSSHLRVSFSKSPI